MDARLQAFQRLLDIMDDLREQCPWDKKQTIESLRHLTIEETYELADAIIDKDNDALEGELGDLFLHLVFYAKIGSETNEFDVTSVLNRICDKLIHRHPHIYADTEVNSEEEVKANWEKLKLKEGKKSVLEGVPKSLPALVKAARIQEKARGIGFEWENRQDVWTKVKEELTELEEAVENGNSQDDIDEEYGDVLFSLINYSRFIEVNAENALSRTNKKFIDRFMKMEELMLEDNLSLQDSSLDKMDEYWVKAKNILKNQNH